MSDAIIHLEAAFEALFKTERDGIKAQVKSGLIQFLGETDELTTRVISSGRCDVPLFMVISKNQNHS